MNAIAVRNGRVRAIVLTREFTSVFTAELGRCSFEMLLTHGGKFSVAPVRISDRGASRDVLCAGFTRASMKAPPDIGGVAAAHGKAIKRCHRDAMVNSPSSESLVAS
jgi:hypothetical protein